MKLIPIFLIFLCSCTGLKNVQDRPNIHTLTEQKISTLDGRYGIFTSDSATTTLDNALTLKKYWWKDWTGKDKYHLSIKAKDARHIDIEVYKENVLLDKKTVKGKIKDGYFVIKPKKVLFFYFLLNGYGQATTRLGFDTSGNLIVDAHTLKLSTLLFIPLAGDRHKEYGLIFPRKRSSR